MVGKPLYHFVSNVYLNIMSSINMTTIESIEMSADKSTTIKVSMETRDKLSKLGTMDDSYDSVIRRLIKYYEDNAKKFDRITRA